MKLVNRQFVKAMERELRANRHKGDWKQWRPNPLCLREQLGWYQYKLSLAIRNFDHRAIVEHSADLANIAMKSYEMTQGS